MYNEDYLVETTRWNGKVDRLHVCRETVDQILAVAAKGRDFDRYADRRIVITLDGALIVRIGE